MPTAARSAAPIANGSGKRLNRHNISASPATMASVRLNSTSSVGNESAAEAAPEAATASVRNSGADSGWAMSATGEGAGLAVR